MANPQTSTATTFPSGFVAGENRHHDRYPAYFDITLMDEAEDGPPISAFIANVSQWGMGVMTPVEFHAGTKVKVQIAQKALIGHVVYSKAECESFRTGITIQQTGNGGRDVADLLRAMLIERLSIDRVVPEKSLNDVRRTASRRHLRHRASGALRIVSRDGDQVERVLNASIENASSMGAKLRINESIPARSYISCHDHASGLSGTASVRYCRFVRGRYSIGLEFAAGSGWRKLD